MYELLKMVNVDCFVSLLGCKCHMNGGFTIIIIIVIHRWIMRMIGSMRMTMMTKTFMIKRLNEDA